MGTLLRSILVPSTRSKNVEVKITKRSISERKIRPVTGLEKHKEESASFVKREKYPRIVKPHVLIVEVSSSSQPFDVKGEFKFIELIIHYDNFIRILYFLVTPIFNIKRINHSPPRDPGGTSAL